MQVHDDVTPNAAAELDARGLACPLPLLKTRQALRHLAVGDLLHVQATDPGSRRDIPAFLGQCGHQLVRELERDGVLHFWIRAGERPR